MKIAAYYARVSTKRQENEATIESQNAEIEEKIKQGGLIFDANFGFIDNGWPGDLGRPGLDAMMNAAKNGEFQTLYLYDFGRLSRDFVNQLVLIDELKRYGIEVVTLHDINAENDEQILAQRVMGLFHDYERKKIAERFRWGKLYQAKNGHLVTSQGPYGYTYIKGDDKIAGYYKVDGEESIVVENIFRWVADEGYTLRGVVRKLQELGIKPRKSKRGVWNTSTLVSLLRNQTYIGSACYNRSYAVVPENPLKKEKYKKIKKTSRKIRPEEEWIKIPVPPIISVDLFDRAQKQLKKNAQLCPRNVKNQYLLSRLIYCVCGRHRVGEGPQKGKHLYYRCADRIYSFPLPSRCSERGINAKVADRLVWDLIKELMSSPRLIREQAERRIAVKGNDSLREGQDAERLKLEVEKLKEEEKRYIKAYGTAAISLERFQEVTNELKERQVSLEKQIGQLNSVTENSLVHLPITERLEEYCKKAAEALSYLEFEEKQTILRKVVGKVVASQKELIVKGFLPFDDISYVKFSSISRNSWVAECWEVHAI